MSPFLLLLATMHCLMARVAIMNPKIFDFLLKVNNTLNILFLLKHNTLNISCCRSNIIRICQASLEQK